MAKAISDEELQLKKRARRRLVGAIALVLLVVVFLPMVLDNEPKPLNQDVSITIPPIPKPESIPQNSAPTQTAPAAPVQPATPHVAGLPEGPPAVSAEPKSEVTKSDSLKSETRPVPKSEQKRDLKSAATSRAGGEESFVVQVGVFSNAANAKSLQKKLQDNKFKAYTETVKHAGADRMRVRVGPYPSREAADKARDRLKAMRLIVGESAVVRRTDGP